MDSNKRRVVRWPAEAERRAGHDAADPTPSDPEQPPPHPPEPLMATAEVIQGEAGPRTAVQHIDLRTGEVSAVDVGRLFDAPDPSGAVHDEGGSRSVAHPTEQRTGEATSVDTGPVHPRPTPPKPPAAPRGGRPSGR